MGTIMTANDCSKLMKISKYYYVSANGEKIEPKERAGAHALARFAIKVFKSKLDKCSESERNKLKTTINRSTDGIWKDKSKLLKAINREKKPTQTSEGYYFFSIGHMDALVLCNSLIDHFKDGGKFVIEVVVNLTKPRVLRKDKNK